MYYATVWRLPKKSLLQLNTIIIPIQNQSLFFTRDADITASTLLVEFKKIWC